jgi:hypothetical protein
MFMRRSVSMLVLIAVSACGKSGPVSYLSTTPAPTPDAYACALRKINELGYTVTNTSREAGFISGEKSTTGSLKRALTGSQYASILTVSIFDDPATKARKIRATAGQSRERSNLLTTSKSTEAPSDLGIADANSLLTACAEGTITRQAQANFVADQRRQGM